MPAVHAGRNPDLLSWLILAGIFVFLLAGYIVSWILDKRRAAALQIAAGQMGFNFRGEGEPFGPGLLPALPLFSKGRRQRFQNLLEGSSAGMPAAIFDYQFIIGSGKNSRRVRQTVAAYQLGRKVTNFAVSPAGRWEKLRTWFGGQDIRFPENPQFSSRFRLQGQDEASIRQLFNPAVQSYFESFPQSHWCVQIGAEWLLVFHAGHRVKPAGLADFVADTSRLAGGLKALLIQSSGRGL